MVFDFRTDGAPHDAGPHPEVGEIPALGAGAVLHYADLARRAGAPRPMPRGKDNTLSMTLPGLKAAGEPELVLAPGTAAERRIPVGDGPLIVGKAEDADIPIDDPHVSRRHARIARTARGVVVEDLDSRNGTFVHGVAVKEALLTPGVVITVGKTPIRFDVRDGRDAANATFGGAVGAAPAMGEVFALLEKLAPTDLGVTLIGETGTGKDVLARAVHGASRRREAPFVVFDCGAVAPNLIESELFGHEKGAFTGAVSEHPGAFERAHGGTLFLDEIGELPLDLQPRLLRALEGGTIKRLGAVSERRVDVRVIAATNRDLEGEVEAGRFRRDLYFRLSGAVVEIPPLRERLEDVEILARAILDEVAGPLGISPATVAALCAHDWPGNVRELKNVLARAAALADSRMLEPRHLMLFRPRAREPEVDELPLAGRTLETLERAAVRQTLEREGGNRTRAAKALGIAPSTLYEKLKKYGIA